MKNKIKLLAVSSLLAPILLQAVGVGVYVPVSLLEQDVSTYANDVDRTVTYEPSVGIGLLFDTTVARNNLVNYRVNFEYMYRKVSNDTALSTKVPAAWRTNLVHTVGFAFVRNENIRVWAGPRINLALNRVINDYNQKVTSFEYGIAPAIGFNYHASDLISLGVDMDYRVAGLVASNDTVNDDEVDPYTAVTSGFTTRFSLIFKFADSYQKRVAKVKSIEPKVYKRVIDKPL